MHAVDIIRQKRDGGAHSEEQIGFFVAGVTDGSIPDYQMSAFLMATFFSGMLIPLPMMPGWLQDIAAALPFAQAIYVPASFLSGINSPANAPQIWLVQLAWLIGLGLLSRWSFSIAVRQVTVQGG